MAMKCAWASQSETKTKNGKVGDQTGTEVKTGAYYSFGQTRIIRAKNAKKRVKIAQMAYRIAANNHFGYGQSNRATAYTELKKVGWKPKKVLNDCNIDCSMMGGCAINCAFGSALISSSVYSGNICTFAANTGKFAVIPITSKTVVEVGDIIVAPGKHVIIAIGDET